MNSLFVNFKATYFRLIEWIRVAIFYYSNFKFLWIELLLASQYLFCSAHRISRDFLRKRGERAIYQYGETPLTTLDHIARQCHILSKDVVYELGCGPGRTLFWLNCFINCRTIGVDYLPLFIKRAKWVKQWSQTESLEFRNENMLDTSLKYATVIYLYGTCLEETTIIHLVRQFEGVKRGTKIITVSYPLTEYDSDHHFKVVKQFPARFPWGKAVVYLNVKQ